MKNKSAMDKLKMPEVEQDEMLELGDEEAMGEDEMMADEAEAEGALDLSELTDDELMAEAEARGFTVTAPEADEEMEYEEEEELA